MDPDELVETEDEGLMFAEDLLEDVAGEFLMFAEDLLNDTDRFSRQQSRQLWTIVRDVADCWVADYST